MIATTRKFTTLLFVACALAFVGCDQPATTNAAGEAAGASPTASAGPRIVYVNVDSLQTGYTELADELRRLEENITQAEANINKKVQSLANEASRFQNKVQQGLIAPNQAQAEQQRLARKEQEIMQQRDLAMQSIQQDQLRLQQRFSERVKSILDDIQAEEQYDYILNRGVGSPVLIGKEEFDITNVVLERLNVMQDSL